jgi:hypothetical protein
MPYMQAMSEEFNARFNRKKIAGTSPYRPLVAPADGTWDIVPAADAIGIIGPPKVAEKQAFLNSLPAGIKNQLREVLYKATDPANLVPVQILWAPGEYNLQEWDVGTGGSRAISLLLNTPWP